MTKVVNSLSTKMEMGSPMICMYLLGNPDHYKSHNFRVFYWQSFVAVARSAWVEKTSKPRKVPILQYRDHIYGLLPVQDYMYCSKDLENMCLYDWIAQCE
ncbi:hypothetical protein L208DRAFT_1325605 [Tricholoma matsutake]|nr:hypothetical protein L208DRAFT_1325605 [Tricholoma matsutake 945]